MATDARTSIETAPRFDEPSLRRPEFQEGEPIILGDGQAWTIPKPRVRLRPLVGDGAVKIKATFTYDSSYDTLLNEFERAEHGLERYQAAFAIAVNLLGRNYDLTPEQYGNLLEVTLGDDSGERLNSILDVAFGNGPKPTPAG